MRLQLGRRTSKKHPRSTQPLSSPSSYPVSCSFCSWVYCSYSAVASATKVKKKPLKSTRWIRCVRRWWRLRTKRRRRTIPVRGWKTRPWNIPWIWRWRWMIRRVPCTRRRAGTDTTWRRISRRTPRTRNSTHRTWPTPTVSTYSIQYLHSSVSVESPERLRGAPGPKHIWYTC